MTINFTRIFQDSWHFVQNQKNSILVLFLLQFIAVLGTDLALSAVLPADALVSNNNGLPKFNFTLDFALVAMLRQLLFLFVAAFSLMTIHQISVGQFSRFAQSASQTLKRFAGLLIVDLVITLPILIGAIEVLVASQQGSAPSLLSLIAMLVGIFFFVRLCLAPLHYLTQPVSAMDAIRQTWAAGIKRSLPLVIYAALIYFVQPLLESQLSVLAGNFIFDLIFIALSSALNVYLLVVSYRFYSLFMLETAKAQ